MDVAIKALKSCIRYENININNWIHYLKNRALSLDQTAERNKLILICKSNILSYKLAIEILRKENK